MKILDESGSVFLILFSSVDTCIESSDWRTCSGVEILVERSKLVAGVPCTVIVVANGGLCGKVMRWKITKWARNVLPSP